ncbi:MAG: pyrroline-5-carboxylate reductase [Candidatus Omnitrophica bacterium]|nr:pyrroline-5-carboxylate reductase [Candidatus Omnitrophota bacterium]
MKLSKLGVVGCGNMGGAIVRGVIARKIINPECVFLNDKDKKKSECLFRETNGQIKELLPLIKEADIIIVAVKPQDFGEVLEIISKNINGQTIVSIAAGITIKTIIDKIGRQIPVVRVMPNMASFELAGMTCIAFNEEVKNADEIKNIFLGIGEVLEVEEHMMDSITALSGSGPAYLFYLAEAMNEAGCALGLEKDIVKKLVTQTLYGSAVFMKNTDSSPGDLIKMVASKGGTTSAALSVFTANKMKDIIKTAILKAKQRSEELSGR